MDLLDNLYDIGMADINLEPGLDDDQQLPNDMITLKPTHEVDLKRYTKDGRDRDKHSIVYKPDEKNYPNPDTTGNGVKTDSTNLVSKEELVTYNSTKVVQKKAFLAKVQINALADNFHLLRSELDKLNHIFIAPKEKITVSELIYKNLVNSKNDKNIALDGGLSYVGFSGDRLLELFTNYFKKVGSLDLVNTDVFDEYYTEFKPTNAYIVLDSIGVTRESRKMTLVTATSGWENILSIIRGMKALDDYLTSMDFQTMNNNLTYALKGKFTEYTEEEAERLFKLSGVVYAYSEIYLEALRMLVGGILDIMSKILPKEKTTIVVESNKLIYNVEKLNPWVGTDYHLLKELRTAPDGSIDRTDTLIENHNKVVKPNDLFLFLGDLSESEFFDHSMKNVAELLIRKCHQLNGKKIMLKGNNDTCSTEFLKKCGFIEVYDDPIILQRIILSHGPIFTVPGLLNVHGHIHGSKRYWNVEHRDHIDAYHGLWGGPIKLATLMNDTFVAKYSSGCETIKNNFEDPETKKRPGNLLV